jgi:hypothetical protein
MAELLGGTTIFNYSAISVVMVWMTVLLTHALALVLLVVFSGHRYADLKLLVKPEVALSVKRDLSGDLIACSARVG